MKIKELIFEDDINYVGYPILVADGVLNQFIIRKNPKSDKDFFFVTVDNLQIGQFELEQAKQKANEINEEKYYFMKDLLKQWEAE